MTWIERLRFKKIGVIADEKGRESDERGQVEDRLGETIEIQDVNELNFNRY